MFTESQGRRVARVADFGYSCLGSKDTDLVKLPDPGVWAAPEWHDRPFQVTNAKKADVYSFGLLCLFILFNDIVSNATEKSTERVDMETLIGLQQDPPESSRSELERSKDQDKMPEIAQRLILSKQDIDPEKQQLLAALFSEMFCLDKSSRNLDLEKLLLCGNYERYVLIPSAFEDTLGKACFSFDSRPPTGPEIPLFDQTCHSFRVRQVFFASYPVLICEIVDFLSTAPCIYTIWSAFKDCGSP